MGYLIYQIIPYDFFSANWLGQELRSGRWRDRERGVSNNNNNTKNQFLLLVLLMLLNFSIKMKTHTQ